LIIGGAVGACLGVLAWLDAGFWLAGAVVFVVVGSFYGIWMSRRMVKYWPGARELTGQQREAVVRATRRGEHIQDARLAQPVVDYAGALHAAAEAGKWWRWLLALVLTAAVVSTVWDAVFGSWGNAVASVVYLAALLVELFWWPKRRDRLLANADRAAQAAERVLERQ
jgi:hypothetical protein